MSKRRVVITGMGCLTPIGNDVKKTWENAKKGTNGIDFIKSYDATNETVKIAGELKDFNPEDYFPKKEIRRTDRFLQLARISAKQAFDDSKLEKSNFDNDRFGVFYGSGVGGIITMSEQAVVANEKGNNRVSPFLMPSSLANLGAGLIAIDLKAKGMCTAPVTACATGTNAIGDAFRSIKDGYHDIILTGGSEAAIVPFAVSGFAVMRALNSNNDPKRASIPFDKERSGFVMGEGAGALVVEEYEHAKARGAKIYAEIVGYGATCDAYHVTAPEIGGKGAPKAMKNALNEAGLKPSDVDYINAHGTSTPLNDKMESTAIKDLFKENAKKVSISSTKSMTGHLLGATGAVEAILSTLAINDSFIPPTINYKEEDPECDLDITPNKGKEKNVDVAMSTSFGFGGHNTCLVFKKVK